MGGRLLLSMEQVLTEFAKLNATTGVIDPTFSHGTGFGNSVYGAYFDGTDGLYLGGAFTTYSGQSNIRIIKINSNTGYKDTSFVNTLGASSIVYNIHSDGTDIFAVGSFSTIFGTTSPRVCKMSTLGVIDGSYATTLGGIGTPSASVMDSSGRLIIGGLQTWQGNAIQRICRLNTDGTLDSTFNTNTGNGFYLGYSHSTQAQNGAISLDSSNNIYISGEFGAFDGKQLNRFVKLDPNGSLDTENNCNYPLVTPTPTNSPTASITPSNTQTPTATPTNTQTPTSTLIPPTPSSTETPTPTVTSTPTQTSVTPTPTQFCKKYTGTQTFVGNGAKYVYTACNGQIGGYIMPNSGIGYNPEFYAISPPTKQSGTGVMTFTDDGFATPCGGSTFQTYLYGWNYGSWNLLDHY